jgi:glucokinase
VFRVTVKYLAMAVTNIAVAVDPEVIVLGGVLQSASDLLFDALRQECARRMPPGMAGRVRLEISTLGPDAAAIGAARFARSGASVP